MDLAAINYLAVAAAAVIGFVVGAVWYAPFAFGGLWMNLNPVTLEDLRPRGHLGALTVALAGSLLQALVLAIMLHATGARGLGPALWLAAFLWLGFTAAPSFVDAQFERRPFAGWLITAGHRLAEALAMGAVLGLWL
ncbi:MAG TPA: DUF1761 domain-containing protein [Gammaproteobacteria bacterium]|nr:DUF1761 domain-containing protein [Gammaproteobacteria bacterium]